MHVYHVQDGEDASCEGNGSSKSDYNDADHNPEPVAVANSESDCEPDSGG